MAVVCPGCGSADWVSVGPAVERREVPPAELHGPAGVESVEVEDAAQCRSCGVSFRVRRGEGE